MITVVLFSILSLMGQRHTYAEAPQTWELARTSIPTSWVLVRSGPDDTANQAGRHGTMVTGPAFIRLSEWSLKIDLSSQASLRSAGFDSGIDTAMYRSGQSLGDRVGVQSLSPALPAGSLMSAGYVPSAVVMPSASSSSTASSSFASSTRSSYAIVNFPALSTIGSGRVLVVDSGSISEPSEPSNGGNGGIGGGIGGGGGLGGGLGGGTGNPGGGSGGLGGGLGEVPEPTSALAIPLLVGAIAMRRRRRTS